MNKFNKYGNSSFWMDKFDNDIDYELLSDKEKGTKDLYKLAAKKRAISNFVSIVTSKQIPVRFAVNGESYTDGETVTISSKIENPSDFDTTVGLALHEGSHIKLSDFEFLRNLDTHIRALSNYSELEQIANRCKGIHIYSVLKDVLNWVEDRRIDNFVYKSAPGYRDYYVSLYDTYFNDKIIDKALKSDEYTDETIESYMFRLINLHSKFTSLNALKGLREIYSITNLQNISRLKSTEDAFMVAADIFTVIMKAIDLNPENHKPKQGGQPQSGEGEGQSNGENSEGEGSGQSNGNESESDESNETNGNSPMSGDMDSDGDGNGMDTDMEASGDGKESISASKGSDKTSDSSLSGRQKQMLDKKIQKQKDFIRGNIKKAKITKTNARTIEVIDTADAEIKSVGSEFVRHGNSTRRVDCILVKKMTRELMMDHSFPLAYSGYDYNSKKVELHNQCEASVIEGIRLGTILGKKLQTRSESRDTVFNRQLIGKIDKRMISALGFGNEHVFYTKETDKYNKANLHISIDASGSMGGTKWAKTMINVVALAKAVDMITNLDIQITFRTTSNEVPYVVVAYDSRKDKFVKVKSLFKHLRPGGTTPEGLCFEALMKYMVGANTNVDSYFVNISDGEPYFYSRDIEYVGSDAARHTRKMVEKLKGLGIKILSYYVTDQSSIDPQSYSGKIFTECYGNASNFINVTNVNDVSKTMNRLFLQK
jgi:hypothetical protein